MAPMMEEKSKVQPDQGQPVDKLSTRNPERRCSTLQVAAPLSEVANVAVERKISQSLPNTVKFDGEDAKPPMVKKQRLSYPERRVLVDLRQGQIPRPFRYLSCSRCVLQLIEPMEVSLYCLRL